MNVLYLGEKLPKHKIQHQQGGKENSGLGFLLQITWLPPCSTELAVYWEGCQVTPPGIEPSVLGEGGCGCPPRKKKWLFLKPGDISTSTGRLLGYVSFLMTLDLKRKMSSVNMLSQT